VKELLRVFVSERCQASTRSIAMAVIYEDCDTHQEATAVFELLLRELAETARVTATWWRTSLLGDSKLFKVAARAVSVSDLIVVSVHDGTEPSPLVKAWVESWSISTDRPPRLVGLLHGRVDETDSDWERYLGSVARRWRMPFIAGSLAAIVEPASSVMEDLASNRPAEPYAHWGLNE
jgi:hypothetical protein